MTRKKWNIPLFCIHTCDENCNILIVYNNLHQYVLLNNPDYLNGYCSFNNKIRPTTIRISTFDINTPEGDMGFLYNPELKVIMDNSFVVSIYFPLSYVFEVIISNPSLTNGFTLKELLYSIKNLYEFIYQEEERTASPQIYQLKKFCSSCGNKDLSEFIQNIEFTNEDIKKFDDCCICYSDYEILSTDEEKKYLPTKLKCGHIYHEFCIKKWLEKSGTCPICRHNIFECRNCDGTGVIYYTFTGVVVPVEERGETLNRNHSNGVFGIHSYDLEDLVIEKMSYDRIKRRLHIDITA
jgi:hypothetical protein